MHNATIGNFRRVSWGCCKIDYRMLNTRQQLRLMRNVFFILLPHVLSSYLFMVQAVH
jgi:hypothetical protein